MLKIKNRLVLAGFCLIFAAGCGHADKSKADTTVKNVRDKPTDAAGNHNDKQNVPLKPSMNQDSKTDDNYTVKKSSLLNPEGKTLKTRISTPEGFIRIFGEDGSLTDFLQNYPLKKDESPVLLYDGTLKSNQSDHVAVFKLPIENEDLQQCADSVMRIYAEYFWSTGQYNRIAFHFVNGFYAEYSKWREGCRISIDGNQAVWTKTADYDDSYENFRKYLRIVFSYAGTLSMDKESEEISLNNIQAGDVFLKGGSPGHVVMLADVCQNAQGQKAFLLAQGFMPAQEFHVLKNPLHEDDPWYYEDEVEFPLFTPEYTFREGSLRRLCY